MFFRKWSLWIIITDLKSEMHLVPHKNLDFKNEFVTLWMNNLIIGLLREWSDKVSTIEFQHYETEVSNIFENKHLMQVLSFPLSNNGRVVHASHTWLYVSS